MGVIRTEDNTFFLNTKNTTYAFRVMEKCDYLEHLYYGRRIHTESADGIKEQHCYAPACTLAYGEGFGEFSMEDVCLELSSTGKGDIREPMIEAVLADGSRTLDFHFSEAKVVKGKKSFQTLPGSYDEKNEVTQLQIVMKDENSKLSLILFYNIFEDCDVITRHATLVNEGSEEIRLTRMLSMMMDFDTPEYVFTTFKGAWGREMKRYDMDLFQGKFISSSATGTSSNRSNPFCMISRKNTTENQGECYGFNLIYSGNHYEICEVSGYGKTRFATGINPQGFEYMVAPGESFEAPEAVMTYAKDGFNAMSQNMHAFVNEHIIRGAYKIKPRPVLLNSWEAAYFDITEDKLVELAKAGKEVGIELFVMDDGWFGERNDDSCSLGDWDVNKEKLPGGLKVLADRITELGIDFGIWVEPEMVNVKSKLYEAHPDWALDIPGKPHSEGRNQRILDLTREDVCNYLIEKMTEVFSSAKISYVKWDMNRIFSDTFSKMLDARKQGEVAHRYVLGLYRVMGELVKRFPEILFEGCASGGNRFDLGILSYFPQIWSSDDTDAICRAEIQNNYSYGYPLSTISAHVSDAPNHQTSRVTPLETRFHVANFGVLGYEFNLCKLSEEDKNALREQIDLYKKWRDILHNGNFYRGRSFGAPVRAGFSNGSVLSDFEHNITEWTCVSKDKEHAVGVLVQKLTQPNVQYTYYKPSGLCEDMKYHFTNRQLDIYTEEHSMYGDVLMYAGVKLKQEVSGNPFNEYVRSFGDFESHMYFMEKED